MRGRRSKLIGIAVAAALLLFPGGASAEKLKGGTSQAGKKVGVTTNTDGSVSFARISWTAPCRFGGRVDGTSRFGPPFDRVGPAGFHSAASDKFKSGKFKVAAKAVMDGDSKPNGSYTGAFKVTLRYTKHGDYFTTCKSKRVKWSAHAG
jgi:hypothetical protein